MTEPREAEASALTNPAPSTLPFDPAQLVAMRVRPAEYARMVGVSKQTVSVWIREGKVTLGPDGMLDPAVATRQVIERSSVRQLRAMAFREAVAEQNKLRERIKHLEADLAITAAATENRCSDEASRRLGQFTDAVEARFSDLVNAHQCGQLADALDRIVGSAYYGNAEDETPIEAVNPPQECTNERN